MKKYIITLSALLFSAYSFSALADNDRPQRPPSFEQMDTNGDGELSKDEVKGPLLDDFDQFDKDGSGTLTEDELPEPPQGRQ
ncbi:EF-hand domain-containing protein [Vibrio aphrogenes]|uniref:hypothetical protein n=1 Tax=Vibrio aphrogenes TaxID=1891186 RepID=UPI000B35AA9B|nr:hypothetical protein [Vibrio aphrogenes]